jgi:hypothetical protein
MIREIVKQSNEFYSVHEQPGDGTRYTHVVQMDECCYHVYKDMKRNGAGFKTPRTVGRHEFRIVEKWEELGLDAYGAVKDLIDSGFKSEENPFTYASVLRCVYEIDRERFWESGK